MRLLFHFNLSLLYKIKVRQSNVYCTKLWCTKGQDAPNMKLHIRFWFWITVIFLIHLFFFKNKAKRLGVYCKQKLVDRFNMIFYIVLSWLNVKFAFSKLCFFYSSKPKINRTNFQTRERIIFGNINISTFFGQKLGYVFDSWAYYIRKITIRNSLLLKDVKAYCFSGTKRRL